MPGLTVRPLSCAGKGLQGPAAAKFAYSVPAAVCAAAEDASLCVANGNTTVADAGKPVMERPGETPTSPVITLPVPAAVTAVPPSTAKLSAAPSEGGTVTAGVGVGATGVRVRVGVEVAAPTVMIGVGVSTTAALQPPTVLVPANVTAPATVVMARPVSLLPTPTVTPAWATTVPAKLTPLSVAALVTCQNTLHASALWSRVTVDSTLAVSALPTWKM